MKTPTLLAALLLLAGCASTPEPYYERQKLVWRHVEASRTADGKIKLRQVEDARMMLVIRSED